jgi:hypothetical protein
MVLVLKKGASKKEMYNIPAKLQAVKGAIQKILRNNQAERRPVDHTKENVG